MSDQPEFIVRRLDALQNDLADLRRLVAAMTDRFGMLEMRMGGLDQRVGGIEQRIGGLETRFGHLEVRMDCMTERYSGQELALARVLLLLERERAPIS
jgi:hypothetical protein